MSKGMIMLSVGAIGLILTVIWILLDLANRKKHEEKVVQKAIQNLKSAELHTNYSVSNNINNKSNKIENDKDAINDELNYSETTEIINSNEEDKNEETEIMTGISLNKSVKLNKESTGELLYEESTELLTELLDSDTEVIEINNKHGI